MSRSPAEAYESIAHAAAMRERLKAAMGHLGQELENERSWLLEALSRLTSALAGADDLLDRAVDLPELGELRTERAKTHQAALATALEWLQLTLVRIAGNRAPIIEALFPARLKLAALRKMAVSPAGEVVAAFERRLSAAYVQRMLAQDDFAPAKDAVEQVRAAIARWRRAVGMPAELLDADSVRQQLAEAAARLEIPLRQARALAEAALAPIPGAFESSGLGAKARRRLAIPAPERAMSAATPADGATARSAEAARGAKDGIRAAPSAHPEASTPTTRVGVSASAKDGAEPADASPVNGHGAGRGSDLGATAESAAEGHSDARTTPRARRARRIGTRHGRPTRRLARGVASSREIEPGTARTAGASLKDLTAAEDVAVTTGEGTAPNASPEQSGEISSLDVARPAAAASEPVPGS